MTNAYKVSDSFSFGNPTQEPERPEPVEIPFEDWEIEQWLQADCSYTWTVEVRAIKDGIEYSATGTAEASNEELIDVDAFTIEEV